MARIFDDSVEDDKSKVKKDGLIYQQRDDTDYKKAVSYTHLTLPTICSV